MCEIIVAGADAPIEFNRIESWVLKAEKYGIAGWGWGIAYLTEDGKVDVERRVGKLGEDERWLDHYRNIESPRWLFHFRRPLRLPNVVEDLQPFYSDKLEFAYAHNGEFEKADEFRSEFPNQLDGQVDSEVGFRMTEQHLFEGLSLGHACLSTLNTLGGTANVAVLYHDGQIWIDGNAKFNKLWQFQLDGMTFASTSLIFSDESFFDLVYDELPTERKLVQGEVALLGPVISGFEIETK